MKEYLNPGNALEGMVTALECAINTFSEGPVRAALSKYPG